MDRDPSEPFAFTDEASLVLDRLLASWDIVIVLPTIGYGADFVGMSREDFGALQSRSGVTNPILSERIWRAYPAEKERVILVPIHRIGGLSHARCDDQARINSPGGLA